MVLMFVYSTNCNHHGLRLTLTTGGYGGGGRGVGPGGLVPGGFGQGGLGVEGLGAGRDSFDFV